MLLSVCAQSFPTLQPHGLEPARLLCPWDFPAKNTGVGCHLLLQGIFLTQGLNPGLPHCRLSQRRSPTHHKDYMMETEVRFRG